MQEVAETILSDVERSGIYKIVNAITGKQYIGSAKCFRVRWNGHRAQLRKGIHHSNPLQRSWLKYGEEAFSFIILSYCEPVDLIENEQAALDLYKPQYNVCTTAGSSFGRFHSDEAKEKIRMKALARKFGPRSAEHCKRISEIHRGRAKPDSVMAALQAGRAARVYTEEHRKQISDSLKAAYASGLRSREKSEDHRNKISQAYSKLTEEQVRQIKALSASGETGRSIAEQFGTTPSTVSQIINGKRYRWVV